MTGPRDVRRRLREIEAKADADDLAAASMGDLYLAQLRAANDHPTRFDPENAHAELERRRLENLARRPRPGDRT